MPSPHSLLRLLLAGALGWSLTAAAPPDVATAPRTNVITRLVWRAKPDAVDARIPRQPLSKVLARIAAATGWKVFVEPGNDPVVSCTFTGLPARDALGRILGDLNYALLPAKSGPARLYIYSTSLDSATEAVDPLADADDDRVPNELIVRLKHGSKLTIEQVAKRLGGTVAGRLPQLDAYRLRFADAAATEAARALLAAGGEELGATYEDNRYFPKPEPSAIADPATVAAAPATGALTLKPAPVGTDRIVIGLVDTGIQPLGPQYDAFLAGTSSVVDGKAAGDSLQHGTSMLANLLRAAEATMGPDAQAKFTVFATDVYGAHENTTTWDVAQGIDNVIRQGHANIVNLSLGSEDDSPVLHSVIAQYSAQGVLFFASAGNSPVTTPTFPAAYPEVMAVSSGTRDGQFASYANRGPFVDLMMPGTGIVPFGGENWLVTGTSTSSAYAAGIAAGIWKSGPPAQLRPALEANFGLLTGRRSP